MQDRKHYVLVEDKAYALFDSIPRWLIPSIKAQTLWKNHGFADQCECRTFSNYYTAWKKRNNIENNKVEAA